METLTIGLNSWIIQDGNYADFERGLATFAVEFYPLDDLTFDSRTDNPTDRLLQHVMANRYRISGRVLHAARSWWALDVGFGVYLNDSPPCMAVPGALVQGVIDLSIDHYAYFENLGQEPGAPALIHTWQIQRIEIQTAPWIEVSPRRFERDSALLEWREIERTDAWNDDGGHAEYLLHCSRTSAPPENRR